jgi:hypothetical protein
MLSPTTESDDWDEAFPDDEDDDSEGASDDESEPGEADGDNASDAAERDDDSAPAGAASGEAGARPNDYESWIEQTLFDPTAIRNVPRGARTAVLAAVEANKRLIPRIVQQALQQQGPQMGAQMAQVQREIVELDELLVTDPAMFKRALAQASDAARAEWYRQSVVGVEDEDAQADQRARAGASRPAPQQQQSPAQRTGDEVNAAVKLELGRVARVLGAETAQAVNEWIKTEGLAATEEDYERLLEHTAQLRAASSNGRRPDVIAKRKRTPKADVSPGTSSARGKRTPSEMNGMSEGQLYDAWDEE